VQTEAKPPFAGSRVALAEWPVQRQGGDANVGLPARDSGAEAAMVAAISRGTQRKQNAARVFLGIGGVAFFLRVWALWLEAGAAFSGGTAESLGWMGALGMATLQMVDFLAFHPHGVLLSLTKVLLLCWPVAVMTAGVVFSHKSN